MSVLRHSGTLTRVPKPSGTAETEWFRMAWRRSENQKLRWNFLTWSFFLAQIIAAQQFLGSGAKAQENENTSAARPKDDSNTDLASSDLLATGSVQSGSADEVGREEAVFEPRGKAAAFIGMSQHAEADLFGLPEGNAGKIQASGGTDAGGDTLLSGAGDSESPAVLSDAQHGGLTLESPTNPAAVLQGLDSLPDDIDVMDLFDADVLGNLLDTVPGSDDPLGLDVSDWLLNEIHNAGEAVSQLRDTTLDQLTGLQLIEDTLGVVDLLGESIDDTLSHVTGLQLVEDVSGLLGDTLNFGQDTLGSIASGSVDTLANQVSESLAWGVAETAGIASDLLELTPLQHTGDVSSGGLIIVLSPTLSSQVDDLFTGGRYSDYNLALQSDTTSDLADTLGSSSVVLSAASLSHMDAPSDTQSDNLLPLSAHDADALLVTQSSGLGELGGRDHLI